MDTNNANSSVWFSIWVRPREAIRKIMENQPRYSSLVLYAIYGFPFLIQLAQSVSLSFYFAWQFVLFVVLLLSPLMGAVVVNLLTLLFYWTGKWIGGAASFSTVRLALLWSNVPQIITCLGWVIVVYLFEDFVFQEDFVKAVWIGREKGIIALFGLFSLTAGVWALVLRVFTLSEVQGFSIGKAVLNILLPFLLIFFAALAVGFIQLIFKGN